MKKTIIMLSMITVFLNAGGNIAPLETTAEEASQSSWSFEFEPYLMITKIEGDTSLGRINNIELEIPFETIWDNLEMAAMAHFEAHHNNGWGFIIDYGFMDLGTEHTGRLSGLTEAGVRQGVLEVFGMYRQELDASSSIDYLAGIRWWDNNFDITHTLLNTQTLQRDIDWVDAVIGARYNRQLDEKWKFSMTGTIGGMELQSDFTASAAIGVKYTLTNSMELDLQYKATWVDYEEGTVGTPDYFSYDTVTHGPVIGLNFKW